MINISLGVFNSTFVEELFYKNNNNNNKYILDKNKQIRWSKITSFSTLHRLRDAYKCPCSKCRSSHVVQETPQLPTLCLQTNCPHASYDPVLVALFSSLH